MNSGSAKHSAEESPSKAATSKKVFLKPNGLILIRTIVNMAITAPAMPRANARHLLAAPVSRSHRRTGVKRKDGIRACCRHPKPKPEILRALREATGKREWRKRQHLALGPKWKNVEWFRLENETHHPSLRTFVRRHRVPSIPRLQKSWPFRSPNHATVDRAPDLAPSNTRI
jgi:hypothetical protein